MSNINACALAGYAQGPLGTQPKPFTVIEGQDRLLIFSDKKDISEIQNLLTKEETVWIDSR